MAAKRTAKKLTVSASQLLTKNMLRLTFHGDDRQVLPVPANIEVQWVINPQAGSDASPLFDAIKQL